MQKTIIILFIASVSLFSSNAFAWRESNGGNGVAAERAVIAAALVKDLKHIPIMSSDYDFTKNIRRGAGLVGISVEETTNDLLEKILAQTCRTGACPLDAAQVTKLLAQYNEIKNKHFNTSFSIDREIVQSVKACEMNRFEKAFELVGDYNYKLKNVSKKIADLLAESKCSENKDEKNISVNKAVNSSDGRNEYLHVEALMLNKMKLIPSLDSYYFSCLDCDHPERRTTYQENVYLNGKKVDAYTRQKILGITTIVDRSAWAKLSDDQKKLLVLHEALHFLINVDVDYNLSVKVIEQIKRYEGLKRFYPNTENFIEKAIAVNLEECDLEAFKENYILLGGAARFYKINGVKVPKAVKASGCSQLIKAMRELSYESDS